VKPLSGDLNRGQTVVVMTHGGIIQMALTQAYGVPVTQYTQFVVPNVSQTELEFEPDGSVKVLST
jgi:broad specificity phosphatase PhoE